MYEEFLTNSDGLAVTNSTWNYKIPTVDTIPKEFNVELFNSPHNKNRILSSKGAFFLTYLQQYCKIAKFIFVSVSSEMFLYGIVHMFLLKVCHR